MNPPDRADSANRRPLNDDPLAPPTVLSGGGAAEKARCNCEHAVHYPDSWDRYPEYSNSEWHPGGTMQEGSHKAQYVGDVCTDCARTHMNEYLL